MKLLEAVEFIQQLEPLFAAEGHHLGLTGSVLFRGESAKDLDLIVYPHEATKERFFEEGLRTFLENNGFRTLPTRSTSMYAFDKTIIVSYRKSDNQRVDFFLLT